jgi:beta-lactamase regulating signal transducer with metallopeptidase domain
MIASWMGYCVLCAAGLSLAAVIAERLLLIGRGPVRYAWVVAVVLSLVMPGLAFRFAPRPAAVDLPASVDATLPIDSIVPVSPSAPAPIALPSPATAARWSWRRAVERADAPLIIAWLVMSVAIAVYLVGGIALLAWIRRRWEQQLVLGVPVLVSADTGPAVVAGLAPAIVVPKWALDLEPSRLSLMLRHEQEHQRARDGQLLFLAQFALVAMPWNAALWWQLRRLRVAVELDCDARVLGSTDARTYGDLLLDVVRPGRRSRFMVATAFAERATQLERRIRVMTRRRDRVSRGAQTVAVSIALASVTTAWIAPRPAGPPRYVAPRTPADSLSVLSTPQLPPVADIPRRDTTRVAAPMPREVAVPPRPPRADVRPETTSVRDTAVAVADTNPVRGGRGGGPGGRGGPPMRDPAQIVESVFRRLFEGISLSADQESKARTLLAQLVQAELAQADSVRPAALAFVSERLAVQARRDSALVAVLSTDADRETLRARLAAGGGRGQRGAVPDSMGGQRSGGMRAGGRSEVPPVAGSPGGRGVGNPPLDFSALLPQMVDNLFHRLFDGITLTPDQEANARAIIGKAQTDLAAIRVPTPPPAILRQLGFDYARGGSGLVVAVSEAGEAALIALVTNEADRETLRHRMLVGGRLFGAPRPPQ